MDGGGGWVAGGLNQILSPVGQGTLLPQTEDTTRLKVIPIGLLGRTLLALRWPRQQFSVRWRRRCTLALRLSIRAGIDARLVVDRSI